MVNKIDSNFTGLRYTLEQAGIPKGLTGSEVWLPLEPNSYTNFGGKTTLTPRKPIVANRQVRQGRTTDLNATAGFALDFTSDNMIPLLPTYFFANWRKDATMEVNTITSITAAGSAITKVGAFATGIQVGSIVLATGFTNLANNGLLTVATLASNDEIDVNETLVDETPPATAMVKVVGIESAVGDLDVDASNPTFPAITSTTLDFTTLGLIPGQWIYVGDDNDITSFSTAGNNGFARIFSIAANALVMDKTQNTMSTEANTLHTVRLWFPDFLKNEDDPNLIVVQTAQFERSLSSAGFEYIEGAFSNTIDMEMKSADKITMSLGFQALTYTPLDSISRKGGTFPSIETDPVAYNTATDLVRVRASEQDTASPLFAFIQTMTLKINNNVKPLKALGVLGAFDVSIGDFDVTGDVTAYFSDLAAVNAVRNADSLTLDWVIALNNRGWIFDVANLTFDKGELDVKKDEAITIPVGLQGAEHATLKTTMQTGYFAYLPSVAG